MFVKRRRPANPLRFIFSFYKLHFSPQKKLFRSLYDILGFCPGNIRYYQIAFVHKSASIVHSNGKVINNERLEYLGDAVLDAVVADFLYHKFPTENEGFLTQMRSKLVNGEKLDELARSTGIAKFVKSNTNRSTSKKHINEDAFEAIIGAVYLDKGYKVASNCVVRIINSFVDLAELKNVDTNFKSQLIEWGQKYKKEVMFTTEQDPKNPKYFVSYVSVDQKKTGTGFGVSKKQAEQKAAKETLKRVLKDDNPKTNQ